MTGNLIFLKLFCKGLKAAKSELVWGLKNFGGEIGASGTWTQNKIPRFHCARLKKWFFFSLVSHTAVQQVLDHGILWVKHDSILMHEADA